MQPEATTLAYLAGVIDSDGYIRIHRTKKTSKGCSRPAVYFSALVGISGTRRQPHDLAMSVFGGAVHSYRPKNPAHREQFQWVAWGNDSVEVLKAIRPLLLIKTQQADLALELQALVPSQFEQIKKTQKPPYRIPDEMTAQRQKLFDALTALNQDRRAAGRLLDGHTWAEFPKVAP